MIRHVHNTATHNFTARAARPVAKTQANTNPFQSILESTGAATSLPSASSAAKSVPAQAATSGSAAITATITKEAAKPAVPLTTPAYEYGAKTTNPDGSVTGLNWTEFADAATAQNIAAKLGGTVVTSEMDGYSATQRSIKVPGSPNLVNAGLVAHLFAEYGDKQGSAAWRVINSDLGRDPMST